MTRGVADSEEVRNAKRLQRYIKYKEWQASVKQRTEWIKREACRQQTEAKEKDEREKNVGELNEHDERDDEMDRAFYTYRTSGRD